jgi:dihydroxyacetone kinase
MNKETLREGISAISNVMEENEAYLVKLDARFGDGDLGISMKQGFKGVKAYMEVTEEKDLGRLLRYCAAEFNEAAPSTLGTVISFGLMGMAKYLKGREETELRETAEAMQAGLQMIMDKAKSKPGDKTILDSLYPAVEELLKYAEEGAAAWEKAYEAAYAGMESTRNMKGMHGRIAYYGEKTIGETDGGAVAGMLMFRALKENQNSQ